ncbi:MarR family transcriptional regulator [Acinetobacter rudis]|uniref:MarR family winged helix-turn-helix transcriptional regulator n=1 Tax=Acinetobacter rudis TaxID=632955 RepID=UPI00280F0F18|nr:MarR family transcriptional regulator [Acinetobacter rudis]MDQ8951772.1 MarR family transcriptional regulator [Acinetobacter rudis]
MTSKAIPEVDQSLYAVHNRLFFRLFQAGIILDRQSSKEMGVSTAHWSVLGALSREVVEQGMSFSDLTHYLGFSRQNLDGILKRLERDQYVKRTSDEQDRRIKIVQLTEKGWEYWFDLQEKTYEFYRQALAGLSLDDKIAFLHLMNKINQNMQTVELKPHSQDN